MECWKCGSNCSSVYVIGTHQKLGRDGMSKEELIQGCHEIQAKVAAALEQAGGGTACGSVKAQRPALGY